MTGRLARSAAAAWWALLPIAVVAHAAVAVLAVAEFAAMGWPLPTWFDTGAVTLVLATATAGMVASARVAMRAAAGSRTLRALIRTAERPVPTSLANQAAGLGCADRLDVVAAEEAFAITYGLIRPRILVSTCLTAALTPAEINAVLVHEWEHVRHHDPLRLLAGRLFAAWGCYLPAARWLAGRARLRRELAADRAAAGSAGRGVLAGALLKLASSPDCPAIAAASPAEDKSRSLESRVTQLEAGRPPRQRPQLSRVLASAGTLVLLAAASLCCAALSQVLPGGVL